MVVWHLPQRKGIYIDAKIDGELEQGRALAPAIRYASCADHRLLIGRIEKSVKSYYQLSFGPTAQFLVRSSRCALLDQFVKFRR